MSFHGGGESRHRLRKQPHRTQLHLRAVTHPFHARPRIHCGPMSYVDHDIARHRPTDRTALFTADDSGSNGFIFRWKQDSRHRRSARADSNQTARRWCQSNLVYPVEMTDADGAGIDP